MRNREFVVSVVSLALVVDRFASDCAESGSSTGFATADGDRELHRRMRNFVVSRCNPITRI
jgi:hypothetical protein